MFCENISYLTCGSNVLYDQIFLKDFVMNEV